MSECRLWQLQEDYYDSQSLNAWKRVPFYPTSRMVFSGMSARLVAYFLLDIIDQIDCNHPVYLIELGGGSGCFAFRFLNEFHLVKNQFPQLENVNLKYILTDFTRSNIEGHLKNPRFRSYLESGLLDVAVFSPQDSRELTLECSGEILSTGSITNPLLISANYFFDTIKHDAFIVDEDGLYETLVSMYIDAASVTTKLTIGNARLKESYNKIELPYYRDSSLDSILKFYSDNLNKATIIFPVGAFNCLKNLETLVEGGRVAVFAFDKGIAEMDCFLMSAHQRIFVAQHGSFSLDVNFDALARFFRSKGGHAVYDAGDHSSLGSIIGTTFGGNFVHTDFYYNTHVKAFDDFNASFNLEEVIFEGLATQKKFDRSSLTIFRSLVQQYNYEPQIFDFAFQQMSERLKPELSSLDVERKRECSILIERTYRNVFNSSRNTFADFASIVEFCFECGLFEQLLHICLDALDTLGEFRKATDFAALACENLGRTAEAHMYFLQSLDIEPGHEWAQEGADRTRI